ncbi:aspartyl-phosphate phosphatase Spo0E family protein [Alkalihalophilus pseudofirmus]|uniref:Aspartyl-phosphate phosphatase Spo0E family protein n=1 Tax=Alkalihalophilus pseudofirmus TaxID=79885 RepID=A0AAJ2U3D2_ALKPS|nr:aspartyl-phosphate phosphatase Spo0E family protein [Alkalihalophilus pseudofirmus]MDV2886407.1 aspartyl-phosphate phosphatase Spo0E family protein [Alkalihalophilus pseudofirmus]
MVEQNLLSRKEIEVKIESLRNVMISSATVNGLAHPETIKYSQELDHMLNKLEVSQP